ncbi:hypothetical protein LTR17_021859 [Elasticomyces elasticus]|nr:hypothetical protein LTR17_021859 [Elasticomyces elasticus]
MAASRMGIDEPLLPPAYAVTDNNRSAYVLITAIVMIVLAGLTVGVKLQTTVSTFRKLRRDDVALVTALHYYAANIFVWPSLAASKCAVALLILALQPPRRWIVITLNVVLGVSAAWGLGATFAVAFQCGPTRYVLGPTFLDTCIDQFDAQIGIRLIDIAIDVALCLIPAIMMMYVQTSLGKKVLVSATFGMRLVTPIFTAISLSALSHFYARPTPTRPFSVVYSSIWTTMTLNVSLFTACLPSIKRVLGDFAAGLSNANILDAFELQKSSDQATSRTDDRVTTHFRLHTRSKVERSNKTDDDANYVHHLKQGRGGNRGSEDAESERRLTDGILQTVDYLVEFEEESDRTRRKNQLGTRNS